MQKISTLICHRDLSMGLTCLRSLARSVEQAGFVLHDDGSLTESDLALLCSELPVAHVVRRRFADEFMAQALRCHPACAVARGRNVLMLKLFDVALMDEDADIRYCDTDVLFFRRIGGLFERDPGDPAAVFMRDPHQAYSARPWHLMGRDALRLPRNLNSGLFMFRRDLFDLDFLEWVLSRDGVRDIFAHIPGWAEQTCWAALGMRVGCGLWDEGRIAVVDSRWALGERTTAAHFVSPSRSRLPDAVRQLQSLAQPPGDPVRIEVAAARECTPLDLAMSQVGRRLRRACGY